MRCCCWRFNFLKHFNLAHNLKMSAFDGWFWSRYSQSARMSRTFHFSHLHRYTKIVCSCVVLQKLSGGGNLKRYIYLYTHLYIIIIAGKEKIPRNVTSHLCSAKSSLPSNFPQTAKFLPFHFHVFFGFILITFVMKGEAFDDEHRSAQRIRYVMVA